MMSLEPQVPRTTSVLEISPAPNWAEEKITWPGIGIGM